MNPSEIEPASPGRTRALVAGIVASTLVGVLGSLVLFSLVRSAETDELRVRFTQEAQDRAAALEDRVSRSLDSLVALESHYLVSQDVDPEDFRGFARHLFEHDLTIQALEWIPRVTAGERGSFEAKQQEARSGFEITERLSQGRMIRALERPEYFPVTLVEPLEGNEIAIGFDVGSEPVRRAALEEARRSHDVAASSRVLLVQERDSGYGVLVFSPVYESGPDDGERALEGFLLGVFRPADILETAVATLEPRGIDLFLFDDSAPQREGLLYAHPSRLRAAGEQVSEPLPHQDSHLRLERTFGFADRRWKLVATPIPAYLAAGRTWLPWGVLFGGLVLTSTLAAYMALMIKRADDYRRFSFRLLQAKQQLEREVEERARKEREARESRQQLEALTEATFDGVAITERGVIVEVNESFARTFGYDRRELRGVAVSELVSPECREEVVEKIAAGYELPYESVCVRKSGQRFPIEVCGKSTLYQGRPARISSVRDLSAAKRLEQERIRAEKLSSVGLLAGGLAHDFNNLLTAIIGNINLAREKALSSPDALRLLTAAERASIRAADLTRQLLTFAKGGEPIKKVVDLGGLVRESATFASLGSNVRCQFSIPEDLWAAEVDPSQLTQVVSNLVLNAVQAMPRGGTVRVTCENVELCGNEVQGLEPGKHVRLEVEDEGIGIDPRHLNDIFDPYFTTKEKGSGLGLATAHSVITRHNGQIGVESQLGGGTLFTVYLPACAKAPPRAGSLSREGSKRAGGRILVMDDDEAVRRVVAAMLESLDFEAVLAANGCEAVDVYWNSVRRGTPLDAVILDLTIPGGKGGLETLRELRKIDPDVVAIVSSGYSDDPIVSRFSEHGFRAAVPKPYRLEDLASALERLFARRRVAS